MARPDGIHSYTARARNWSPVLIWMITIFLFSSDLFSAANTTPLIAPILSSLFPDLQASHLENLILAIRKLAHLSEYFILAWLLMRALLAEHSTPSRGRRLVYCIVWVVVYAISDELHQAFVPSRTASVGDVLIDALGGVLGSLWFHLRNRHSGST